jgi:hypothetical protein
MDTLWNTAGRRSVRSLLRVAQPMCCLNIVWMVVSPSSSHTFGLFVVWHDVVVIRELFVADCTFPVLLDNFSIQQFPHLCW